MNDGKVLENIKSNKFNIKKSCESTLIVKGEHGSTSKPCVRSCMSTMNSFGSWVSELGSVLKLGFEFLWIHFVHKLSSVLLVNIWIKVACVDFGFQSPNLPRLLPKLRESILITTSVRLTLLINLCESILNVIRANLALLVKSFLKVWVHFCFVLLGKLPVILGIPNLGY